MNSERTIRRALRLLRWFCPPDLLEEIEGDLLQRYDRDAAKATPVVARRRLVWNVVRYFRPGILLRHTFSNPIHNVMIKSYFITASRNLRAHRSNTLINVMGLVVGIASAIILLSIIRFETSFDHQHTAFDRIYRIVRVSQVEGQTEYRTGVSYPLPPVIDEEVPQVEAITSVLYWGWAGIQVDVTDETGKSHNKFQETTGFAFVEPSFFSIFDYADSEFRWLHGNPDVSLSQPDNIVLTRSLAMKYFGTTDVLGKTIRVDNDWDCKVTGVIENIPENSDFPFTFLMSYATLNRDIGYRMDDWWSVGVNESYVRLRPGSTKEETDAQIEKAHAAHTPKELHSYRKYKLQPLNELHTDARFGNFNSRVVSEEKIWMLAVIALFLVLVACINYVNLSTAQSAMRSKEIGIRKVLGSLRKHLVLQFMTETLLLTMIASVCGLLLAEVASTTFQTLLSIPTGEHIINDPFILKTLAIMIVMVSLLAGVYPAFVLSGFNPIAAIKTKLASHAGKFQLRKVLVVAQFGITQFFVMGTFVVMQQLDYFNNTDLGFERKAIINMELQNADRSQLATLTSMLRTDPAVAGLSVSSSIPSGNRRPSSYADIRRKGAASAEGLVYEYQFIDTAYFSIFGIKLSAGRNFMPGDTSQTIIINHTLAMKAGFESDEAAIGQEMIAFGKGATRIVGVVEDYHDSSLHGDIGKIGFYFGAREQNMVSVKLGVTGLVSLQEAVQRLQSAWNQVYPGAAISYEFFDQKIAAFYREEQKFSNLLQIFSGVLVVIGCLGLYGLIAFVVNRRMKEVALRKVMGATPLNVLALIAREYVLLIVMAFVLAAPLAYYALQDWLNGFAYHITISWWALALPGLLILAIALVAVSGKSLSAAQMNPADTLRTE